MITILHNFFVNSLEFLHSHDGHDCLVVSYSIREESSLSNKFLMFLCFALLIIHQPLLLGSSKSTFYCKPNNFVVTLQEYEHSMTTPMTTFLIIVDVGECMKDLPILGCLDSTHHFLSGVL